MKYYVCFVMAFVILACNSKPENGNAGATTSTTTVSTAPQAVAVSADCKRVGTSIDKFEQNNAVFERLQNTQTAQEWLKITTKDGGCTIIDSLVGERESVRFEDWDKDGFKDRINESKWYYEVALFNAQANNFSRSIDGVFSGDQWDYDKARGLQYQCLEGKMGCSYELYKISDLKKLIYAQISIQDPMDDGGKYEIEVVNRKGGTDASEVRSVVKTSPLLIKAAQPLKGEDDESRSKRVKAAVEDYWRKNEAVFVPK